MPRKGHIGKKETVADPIYNSTLVTKFINSMMWDGKRSTAQGIFYNAMSNLQAKGGDEAIKLFKKAVENTKPLLEVKTRRVGGANYQVPVEVNPDRRTSLAIRWIVSYARGRGEKGMVDKLTNELLDAANGRLLQEERAAGLGGYYASPVAGDGKIFFASEQGILSVIASRPEWKLISSHNFHEKIYATPLLERDRIYIRTDKALYCFSGTAGS